MMNLRNFGLFFILIAFVDFISLGIVAVYSFTQNGVFPYMMIPALNLPAIFGLIGLVLSFDYLRQVNYNPLSFIELTLESNASSYLFLVILQFIFLIISGITIFAVIKTFIYMALMLIFYKKY